MALPLEIEESENTRVVGKWNHVGYFLIQCFGDAAFRNRSVRLGGRGEMIYNSD